MGWFSDVTNFLSSPGFRIGAGVAGLAAGAGLFDNIGGGFGEALTYGAGAANLAAGAASTFGPERSALDRATGALQMGLGGYNLFQNTTTLPFGAGSVGGYGNFGQVYDRLMDPNDNFQFYRPAGGGETITLSQSNPVSGPVGAGLIQDPSAVPTPVPAATPPGVEELPVEGRPATEEEVRRGITGRALRPPPGGMSTTPRPVSSSAPLAVPTAAAAAGGGASPYVLPAAGAAVAGGAPMIGGLPVVGFTPQGQAIVSQGGQLFARPIPPAPVTTAQGFSGFVDRLVNYATTNPLQATMGALQIGGMLVSLFGQSQGDVAREALDEATRRSSASSPDGTEFRRLYEERAKQEIERQYAEVRSGLDAKFGARGMLRSTVFTTALDQLERSRTELIANLPYNSLVAWNQVAQTQTQAMGAAANYARVAAPQQLDFSSMTRVLAQSPMVQSLSSGR